jgi:hypothetical protein
MAPGTFFFCNQGFRSRIRHSAIQERLAPLIAVSDRSGSCVREACPKPNCVFSLANNVNDFAAANCNGAADPPRFRRVAEKSVILPVFLFFDEL